ncbi:MAG: sulfite exporter TauE/SafE family protein [Myxococcota bacterium]
MWFAVVTAGAAAGIASVPHCAVMCGPLAAFACARGERSGLAPVAYQLGRTLSYAALGVLAGSLGHAVTGGLSHTAVAWVLSWAMAAALGIAAWRLWSHDQPARVPLVPLRRARRGPSLFERAARFLPKSPLAVGALTALLPCGALAAAVVVAAGTTSPAWGAASMVAFATTSGVGLLGVGYVARRLRLASRPVLSRSLAVGLALGAILLALRPLPLAQATEPEHSPTATTCPLHPPPGD